MEWAKKVRERLNDIAITDSLRVASRSVLPMIGQRVFEDGKNPQGAVIGQYSTNPIGVSKKNTPRGPGGYFPGGYKEFKESIGMPGTVNLRLFGVLMRGFYAMKETVSGNSITLSLSDAENVMKKDVAVEKYGDPFGFSIAESAIATMVFKEELQKRLFNA
jgi:hypothetical protein